MDVLVVADPYQRLVQQPHHGRQHPFPTETSRGQVGVDLGPQVGEGRVSYALAFRFQPARAGDEKAVEKAMNKVAGSLRHHLGAEIR